MRLRAEPFLTAPRDMKYSNIYDTDFLRPMCINLANEEISKVSYKLTIFPNNDPDEYETLMVDPIDVYGSRMVVFHLPNPEDADKFCMTVDARPLTKDMGGAMTKTIIDAVEQAFGFADRTYSIAITDALNGEILEPDEFLKMAGNALMDAGSNYEPSMLAKLSANYMEMQDEVNLSYCQMQLLKPYVERFATQALSVVIPQILD